MSGGAQAACYCYAVARPFPAERLSGLRGVEGAEVCLVASGELVSVVSPVPPDEFDEPALRRKLEDLEWLARVARAHSAVVDTVAASVTALPLRLATVYLDGERVRQVLRDGEERFTAALDRLSGRAEWGVKVSTRPPEEPPRSGRQAPGSSDRPGRSYLRHRLAQRDERESAWQRAAAAAREIDGVLAQLSEERREHRPQSAQLSGTQGENVLNVAYLVPHARSEEFRTRVAELREAATGCEIELTGPWAPYSFVPENVAGERENVAGTPKPRSEVSR